MDKKQRSVTICRKIAFSSGHRTYHPDLSREENQSLYGSSYSDHGHGHNYVLEAHVEGPLNMTTGMVMNLKDLDRVLKEVTDPLDHRFLNYDVPYFQKVVPTTENLAAYCFQEIDQRLRDREFSLRRIRLFEGADFWVDCVTVDEPKGSGA